LQINSDIEGRDSEVTFKRVVITNKFTRMCLIVFSHKIHEKYPLILAGNRDEFYNRPAKEAHYWSTNPPILAGKDLKAGGTWLGISRAGLMAALTNYRDLDNPRPREKSRGGLIPELLTNGGEIEEKLEEFVHKGGQYDGFNMIAGSRDELFYINNIDNRIQKLEPGNYGISNAFLNTAWPKVDRAKKEFSEIISHSEIDEEAIFAMLQNRDTYPLGELPETGLSPEMEKAVSSIFIDTGHYGTRCSTLLMASMQGTLTFVERTFPAGENKAVSDKRFVFEIE